VHCHGAMNLRIRTNTPTLYETTQTIQHLSVMDGFGKKSIIIKQLSGSRDNVVGIATGYGLEDRGVGVQVPVGSRILTSPRLPD
jgi:hypothetical protein